MKRIRGISLLLFSIVFTLINNSTVSYAESDNILRSKIAQENLVGYAAEGRDWSNIDPKMLIEGDPSIDPGIMIWGNPNIDPKIFVGQEVKEVKNIEDILKTLPPQDEK